MNQAKAKRIRKNQKRLSDAAMGGWIRIGKFSYHGKDKS